MKELDKNPDYLVKLPVFLDATCSGIQHFAALLQDFELGSKVNLIPQSDNQPVEDIYSEIIKPINLALNNYGKENLDYINLSLIKLNRKILKLSIMTKVYNVTNYGMAEQIRNHLKVETNDILLKENKKKTKLYLAPGIDGGFILINNADIIKIAQIINEEVFTLFPSLNYIYHYFIDISKLMIKLNIPLSWITPAGMKITQHYLKTKKSSIAIRFAGKIKKMVLKEWTDKMDTSKQTLAIIPNIIHSLDANHLINLLNKVSDLLFYPVITVHDCFGTHPNKMGELEHMVKKEFILLYTKDKFIQKFHDRIIDSILDNNYIIENENNISYVIDNNRKKHIIPIPPKLGTLDLQKIIESKYMIT